MTHCTNCSCPMTCNAFERCVREPDAGVLRQVGETTWIPPTFMLKTMGEVEEINSQARAFARSATPHRTETP